MVKVVEPSLHGIELNVRKKLKRLLVEPPVLAYADFDKPFILHTDACGNGLGAVLYQEQDGKERAIAFASRSLTKSDRNYPTHKLFGLEMGSDRQISSISSKQLFHSIHR